MTDLVKKNVITPLEMADKMSYTPAKIIGIDKGTLLVGKTADIIIATAVSRPDIPNGASTKPLSFSVR